MKVYKINEKYYARDKLSVLGSVVSQQNNILSIFGYQLPIIHSKK